MTTNNASTILTQKAPKTVNPTAEVKVTDSLVPNEETALVTSTVSDADILADIESVELMPMENLPRPYLRLIQSTSDCLKESDASYIEEAKAGHIINTSTLQLCKDTKIVPLSFETTFVEWSRGNKNSAPIKTHGSGYNRNQLTYDSNEKKMVNLAGNPVVETVTYYLLVVDEEGRGSPAQIALTGTQVKKSKSFNALIASAQVKHPVSGKLVPAPFYWFTFNLTSVEEKNDKGSWYGWRFSISTPVMEISKDLYNLARSFKK